MMWLSPSSGPGLSPKDSTLLPLDLLANLLEVDRPINRLTGRLVSGIPQAYKAGDRPIPEHSLVLANIVSHPCSG